MPSTTLLNIIKAAAWQSGLSKLPGTGPGTDLIAQSIPAVNRMMGSLNLNEYYIFSTEINEYTWPANETSQTFGPTGDFVRANAPWFIDAANWILPGSSGAGEVDLWLRIARNDREYASLSMPNLQMTFPMVLFCNGAQPNSTIYLYPTPQQSSTLKLYEPTGLKMNFTDSSDTVYLQVGWEQAIVDQLTLVLGRLNPLWSKMSADMRAQASLSLRRARNSQVSSPPNVNEAALINGAGMDSLQQRITFLSGGQA